MPPENEHANAWERELDRRLKDLPDFTAPPSLVAKVMAALDGQPQGAWYRRPATSWPRPLQAVLGLGALALTVVLVVLGHEFLRAVHGGTAVHALDRNAWPTPVAGLIHTVSILVNVIRVIGEALLRPWVLASLAGVIAVYVTLISASSALWQRLTSHARNL